MVVSRILSLIACTAAAAFAAPASAQFYLEPPKLRGPVVDGSEPGIIAQTLTGATPAEYRAALVWNMRAALNVAALQCQFEPTLLTLQNYNALLGDHATELKTSYDTLTKYFVRTAKSVKAGQTALDQYGTRVYSSFSTVAAQRIFCLTASNIGHDALFTPRGSFGTLAQERMREMRSALVPSGEQRFRRIFITAAPARLPSLDPKCWKKADWQPKKCGPQVWG